MNLEEAKQEFMKYTEPYRKEGDMCILKINHTMRVVELCRKIAESLSLPKEDIELAEMCGLLHDIGRFEQWKNYQTFDDSKSEDHAELGIQILKENNFIRRFVSDESLDDLIYKSIHFHNKYRIDDGLSEREELFCKLIRDADKIDILYLCVKGEIHIDLKEEAFSEKIYHELLNKKDILKKDRETRCDIVSVFLGFIFDIYYLESFKILKEKNYMNQLIDLYENTKNQERIHQLEEIRKVIQNKIEEMVTC